MVQTVRARVVAKQVARPVSVLETEEGLRVEVEEDLDPSIVYRVSIAAVATPERIEVKPC